MSGEMLSKSLWKPDRMYINDKIMTELLKLFRSITVPTMFQSLVGPD